jgi:hypothetical protein
MTLSAYNTVGLLMWFSSGKSQSIQRLGPRHTHVAATTGHGRVKATPTPWWLAANVGRSCYRNSSGGTTCVNLQTGQTMSF